MSCGREPTGPVGGARESGPIAFRPIFPQAFLDWAQAIKGGATQAGQANQTAAYFDRVRVVLRNPDGTIAKDTTILFPAGVDEIPVELTVILPGSAPASGVALLGGLTYLNGSEPIFTSASFTVTATAPAPGAPPPPPIVVDVPLSYTGPGASATQVVITPKTQTVNTGAPFTFGAAALNASGAVVPNAPIAYTSSAPAVGTINPTTGVGTAGAVRGTATITARLANGATDVATLTVVAPPASIAAVPAAAPLSANVNAQLPTPVVVQVNATDGQPSSGVVVTFAAQNGGTVGSATATTGADGRAQTTWRLGPTPGTQTLTASAAGLSGSPVTFSATAIALPATRLEFVQQPPTSFGAGVTLSPSVAVRAVDVTGALVSTFTGTVSLALGPTSPAGATLGGTTSVAAVAGVATFGTLTLTTPGQYTLVASAPAATPSVLGATSNAFAVTAGAANRLVFQAYPVLGGSAGTAFDPITVAVRDNVGNTVTGFTGPVTLGIATAAALMDTTLGTFAGEMANAVLSGTTTVNAIAGVATFTGISTTTAGPFTLTATAAGLTSAAGPSFTVAPATASLLSLVSGGGQTVAAGAALPDPIVVKVSDAFGNGIGGRTVNFAVATGAVSVASTTSGPDGSAQVNWTLGAAPGAQTLNVTSVGLTPSPLAVTATATGAAAPGTATQLAFTGQPTNVLASAFTANTIVVTAKDALGNVATSFIGAVTIQVTANANGAIIFNGTTGVSAVAGVATFSPIQVIKAGTYTLTATSAGLTNGVSAAFTVSPDAATAIVVDSGGSQTGSVITALPAKLVARVVDPYNNPVPGVIVAWNITGGGGALSGTTTVTDANGRVRATLTLGGTPGANTVTATATGVATPATFNETATAVATTWDFTTDFSQTSATFHDWTIGARPGGGAFVAMTDSTTYTSSQLFNWSNPATAANCTRNRSGGSVSAFTATWSAGQTSCHPGNAGNDFVAVRWTSPIAGTVLVNATFSGISTLGGIGTTVNLHGSFNGTATWNDKIDGSVVLPVGPIQSRTFSGVKTVAIGDVIEFTIDNAGLQDSDATGVSITITGTAASAGSATQLVFQQQPTTANAGAAISPNVSVRSNDGFGNLAASFAGAVSLAMGTNPGSTTLAGTTAVNAAAGIATFPGISIPAAGAGYTIVASNPTLTPATSAAFNINAAGATKLIVTQGPAGGAAFAASNAITPTIQVTAKDALNNTDVGFTGPVALSFHINAGGDTAVAGTKIVNAVAGVASFPTINIRKAGAGYKLLATSGGLAADSTNAFDIIPDTPFFIVADSGGSQSASTGQALANPFVARVTDQFGNKIVGHNVTWNVTGGGGSLAGVTTTTDVNGRVRATLTTGATPGVNTVTATATGVGTPATFTASGNLVVANMTWTGATSTDWHVATNWSPNGVPSASDSVVINPGGSQPVLTANATTARLTVNSGATLGLGAFILDASGNVNVPATGVRGTGKIRMDGANVSAVGVFPNLEVSAGLTTAAGSLTVGGTLTVSGGRYDVGSGTTTTTTLTTTGGGGVRMQNVAANLYVTNASWNGLNAFGDSLLTAGTIHVTGIWSFGGCTGGHTFNASGTHTVSFEGAGAQALSSGCYIGRSANQEHYANVIVSNAAGVSISNTLDALGQVTVAAGATLTGTGTLRVNAGGLNRIGVYTVTNTTMYGTGGTTALSAQSFNNVTLDGAHTFTLPASGFTSTGTLTLSNNTILDVGATTTTLNNLTLNTSAHVRMQNAAGDLSVTGALNWNTAGGYADTLMTAGVLRIKGSWNWGGCAGTHTFNASGTHTVSFEGTGAQSLNGSCYNGTGVSQEHFQNLVIANTAAAVSLTGTTDVIGAVTVNAGATLSGGGTLRVVAGSLTRVGSYTVTNTTFYGTGGTTALPAQVFNNLTLDGAHTYTLPASGFTSTGTLTLSNSAILDVGATTTTINTLTQNTNAHFRMQNAAGDLSITGSLNLNTAGGYADTLMTAGILRIKGSWNWGGCAGSHTFNASGTHTVSFEGTGAQTLNGNCYGGTGVSQEHFRNLVIANTAAAVSLTGTIDVTGTVTVNASTTLSGGGTLRVVAGTLTRVGSYTVTNTTFWGTGGSTALPAQSFNNLTLDGAHTYTLPASGFTSTGTLTLANTAILDVGATTTSVNNLTLSTNGHFRMQNAAGDFSVTGALNLGTAGGYADTLMTAGILRIKGSWNWGGCAGTHTFNAAGTHTVSFEGTGAQTLNGSCYNGTGANQEHLRNLVIANTAAAVSLTGTTEVTGVVTVNSGATLAGGGTLRINAGSLSQNGTYTLTNTTYKGTAGTTVMPAITVPNLVLDGAHEFQLPASGFAVTGALTVQNSAALDVLGNTGSAGTLTVQSSSKLRMTNGAGQFAVSGSATFNSAGVWGDSLLTAGTLKVGGTWNFGGCAGSHTFNASGTHIVEFNGTAVQTVNSGCYAGSGTAQEHFGRIKVSNTAANVNFSSVHFALTDVTVNPGSTLGGTGTLKITAGALIQNGTYSITNTSYMGNGGTSVLPGVTVPNLILDGAHEFQMPASGFAVTGTLTLQNSTVLDVLGNSGSAGSLNVNSTSKLRMKNAAGQLAISGAASFNSAGVWGDSVLTAGTLKVGGGWNFGGCAGSATFNAAGTHIVEFTGAQTVNAGCYPGTGLAQEHFGRIKVSNASGTVSFSSTHIATTDVTVDPGATLGGTGTLKIAAGALTQNGTYAIANTTYMGAAATTILPAITVPSLILDGAHNFQLPAGGFVVTNGLSVINGAALDVLGNTGSAGSLTVNSGAKFRMTTSGGVFNVTGAATFGSAGVWGDSVLTNGTLKVGGTWNFGGCAGSATFNAAGTHVVEFNGSAGQTINAGCYSGTGLAQEHFGNVVISNTAATVSMGSGVRIVGTYTQNASTAVSAGSVNLHGSATYGAGATAGTTSWTITRAAGQVVTLPAIAYAALTVDSGGRFIMPTSGFSVTGTVNTSNGAILDVGDATATIGALTTNTSSRLRMTDPAGVLTVNGVINLFATGVPYRDTSLVAGTLRTSGGISGTCGSEVFNARGTHIIEVFGTGNVSIGACATSDTSNTGFHINELRVNKSAGTLSMAGHNIMGKLRVQNGTFGANGPTAWDSVEVTGGTLTGTALTYRKTNQVIPNNAVGTNTLKADASIGGGVTSGAITVDSVLLDHTGNATITGNLYFGNGARLRMMTASTLTVNGDATFSGGSTAGLLQAGRLEIKGYFGQGITTTAFAPDSVHRTVFNGTGLQGISFAHPGSTLSRFNELELANVSANSVQLQSTNVIAKGNLIVPAGAGDTVRFTSSGVSNLTVGGVDVSSAGSTRLKISGVALTISSVSSNGSIAQFDNVTFGAYATSANQLTFAWTPPGSFTFTGLKFTTVPNGTSGHYVVMNSGISTSLTLASATPGGVTSPLSSILSGILNWP